MILDVEIIAADVERALGRIQVALEPFAMLGWMKEVLEPYLQERVKARFATEGDKASGKWDPLSDATISFRTTGQVNYGSGQINVRTGELERYVTDSSGSYTSADGDSLMVYPGRPPTGSNATGSLEKKLVTAQAGLHGDPVYSDTPARPVLALGSMDRISIVSELELYIIEASSGL